MPLSVRCCESVLDMSNTLLQGGGSLDEILDTETNEPI
jgi:hypothetical protein